MFYRTALVCLGSLIIVSLFGCGPKSENPVLFQEDFERGSLDSSRWEVTSDGDFAEAIVDVIDIDATEATDYRLRLGANTIGTSDPLKYLGVRSTDDLDFSAVREVAFDLDWNDQANGCYLTAGLYLCPVSTDKNPGDEPNWLAFEYLGVPPGKNARFQITSASEGSFRFLFTEGWPDKQRTGREIANQHVELTIDKDRLKVMENGEELFSTNDHGQDFTQAYLYLQMSSHSNYPSRELYFDNIVVKDTLS